MLSRLRLPVFAAIWCAGVLACIALGAVVNVASQIVTVVADSSPSPFELFNRLSLWRIAQGAYEGFWFGVATSSGFSLWALWTTRAKCSFDLGVKHIFQAICVSFLFYLAGGINAVLLARFFPEWMENSLGWPARNLAWVWATGSVWGTYFASVPAMIFACYKLHKNWHAQK